MTTRPAALLRGLAATLIGLILLAGTPYLLYRLAGWPAGDLADTLRDPLASDNTKTEALLRGGVAVLAWICWTQLAYALAAETVAAIRGTVTHTARLLPGIQHLAARLVATATLTFTTIAPAPLAAAPLTVTAAVAEQPVAVVQPAMSFSAFKPASTMAKAPPTGTASTESSLTHTVASRDTLWNIAERYLGDGLRWRDIRTTNLGRTMPDGTRITDTTETIKPGWQVWLPNDATAPLTVSPTPPDTTSVGLVDVDPGDHFWQLAKDTLTTAWGRTPNDHELAPYWSDLVNLNRDRLLPPGDPNLIYPGQQFKLPPIPADPNAALEAAPPTPSAPTPPAPPTKTPPTSAPPVPPTTLAPTTLVPTTSAPTTRPPTSAPLPNATTTTDTTDASGDADDDENIGIRTIALGLGGLATGAAAIAATLKQRRRHQAARRQPGTMPQPPTAEAVGYEAQLRHIADHEALRWIDATNRYLAHQLAQNPDHPRPAVIAAQVGHYGVEFLLDEPCLPVDGFVDTGNRTWRLHPNLELPDIETAAEGAHPYSPALLPVGRTDAGDLLLEVEQLSVIGVQSEPDHVTGWFRTLATAISNCPWSRYSTIVAIGVDDTLAALDRVEVPDDPDLWVAATVLEMQQLQAQLDASPYEQRINHGDVFHPTIALIGPGHEHLAAQIAEVATLINTPIAMLTTTALPVGARIHLAAEHATLEPYGITFRPAVTTQRETELVAELHDNSDEDAPMVEIPVAASDIEVDTSTPVDELIASITRKRPIEVQILTPRPRVHGLGKQPKAKSEAVIAYLAYHRSVSSQTLRETFWANATNRSTADNAISEVRRLLGTNADGTQRLSIAINTGRNEVSDEIGCDWHKAKELIDTAKHRDGCEAIELLRAALELVGGRVASDANRFFGWLADDYEVYGEIERTIADAAFLLGELALAAGDPAIANWASEQGVRVVPGCAALICIAMRAAAVSGSRAALDRCYQHAAREGTRGFETTDEVLAQLYEELVDAMNGNTRKTVGQGP